MIEFYDPASMTAKLQEFTAKNFNVIVTGLGPTIFEIASTLHGYNPDVLVLSYLNSRTVLESDDHFQQRDSNNPGLFALDVDGARIQNARIPRQRLIAIEKPEWGQKMLEWINELSPAVDGVFLDDMSQRLETGLFSKLPVNYSDASWNVSNE